MGGKYARLSTTEMPRSLPDQCNLFLRDSKSTSTYNTSAANIWRGIRHQKLALAELFDEQFGAVISVFSFSSRSLKSPIIDTISNPRLAAKRV
jgi:hypothetical protein